MAEARTGRRPGAVAVAAIALGVLVLEALRVWLPSVLFVVGEAGTGSALSMGAFALGMLAAAPLAGALAGRTNPRWWWVAGAGAVVGALLALEAASGGTAQAVASTVAVVGGMVALAALTAGGDDPAGARGGFLTGVAASAALQAALGTLDLAWRGGAAATVVRLVMVLGGGWAMARAGRELDAGRSRGSVAAAWPWLVLGPALTLGLVLLAPSGRVAVALEATGGSAGAVVAALAALAVLAALATRGRRTGTAVVGATLAVLGTAGALDAVGPRAVASQALLALGLGAVVGSLPDGAPSSRGRVGATAGAGGVVLGLLVLATYAPYDLALPFSSRSVPLVAALALVALALAGRRAERGAVAPGRRVLVGPAVTVAVALALAGVALLTGRTVAPTPPPTATVAGDELTVVLANVRMGYDEAGRFRAADLAARLVGLDADVVVLNEVDRGWLTTGGHDVGAILARATGMRLVFAPAADEVWGNAVLTRLDVREVTVERLPRGRDPMHRSQVAVVLGLADGRELAVVATHLSHVDLRGDTRLPQTQAVAATAARMTSRGLPTVVAGDLNAEPGSPELDTFAELVTSALDSSRPTYPASAPRERIDHVLVSSGLTVVRAEVLPDELSDHRFLRVVLRLTAAD